MIQYLHIQNFQSHKDTDLKFHPGVNIIVGPSDSGKTAIIRALRWLVWNRPLGDRMRSNKWEGELSVEVGLEEQTIVHRTKETYTLGIPGKKDTVLRAFGTDVPEEISNALNIEEVNLQMQLDQPFLISKTSGEVAAYFNKVANLEKIGLAQSNIKKWLNRISTTLASKRVEKEKAEESLLKYAHVEKFEAEVEVLENMETTLSGKRRQVKTLDDLIANLVGVEDDINKHAHLLSIEPLLNSIFESIGEKKTAIDNKSKLSKLIEQIKSLDTQITEKESILSIESDISVILDLISQRKAKEKEFYAFTTLKTNLDRIVRKIETAEALYSAKHKEFEDNFPDVCPLCSKPK